MHFCLCCLQESYKFKLELYCNVSYEFRLKYWGNLDLMNSLDNVSCDSKVILQHVHLFLNLDVTIFLLMAVFLHAPQLQIYSLHRVAVWLMVLQYDMKINMLINKICWCNCMYSFNFYLKQNITYI